ncbi:MAG: ferrous iron transport protein A [Clostridia bacterium]|nr:ferrous iron transport protein A [Clostridia bacterium]
MRRLTELRIGEAGVITGMDVYNGCNRRLLAMGFTPGTQIQLCRRAPAGDPLLVRLRGYQLMLCRDDAAHILLK